MKYIENDELELMRKFNDNPRYSTRSNKHRKSVNKLLIRKFVYIAFHDQQRFVHLTPKGKEILNAYGLPQG
jgi:hypothetical protein